MASITVVQYGKPSWFRDFLSTCLLDAHQSFPDLVDAYLDQKYGLTNGLSLAFAQEGLVASEIVMSAPLIEEWKRLNGLADGKNSSWLEYFDWNITRQKPDILYLADLSVLKYMTLQELRRRYKFIHTIVAFCGYPNPVAIGQPFDCHLVATPGIRSIYSRFGTKSELLYHAYDSSIAGCLSRTHPDKGAVFAGSSGYGYGRENSGRYEFLKELAFQTELELWLDEVPMNPHREVAHSVDTMSRLRMRIRDSDLGSALTRALRFLPRPRDAGTALNRARLFAYMERDMPRRNNRPHELPQKPLRDLFPSRAHSAVYGLEMYELFASSNVVINRHTDRIDGEVGNLRMFEATGVGACLLVDRGSNLGDLFVDGEEVVSYDSINDCVEKLNFLVQNPDVASHIGRRGQSRTLTDHTYSRRAKQILARIR